MDRVEVLSLLLSFTFYGRKLKLFEYVQLIKCSFTANELNIHYIYMYLLVSAWVQSLWSLVKSLLGVKTHD